MIRINEFSHTDHGLGEAVLEFICEKFASRRTFFIETVQLPKNLGQVPCGLEGPAVGDPPVPEEQVYYEPRGDRPWVSRLVKRTKLKMVTEVTIICGPDLSVREEDLLLYTAFGGPLAPQELGDPSLPRKDLERAEQFWKEHALVVLEE